MQWNVIAVTPKARQCSQPLKVAQCTPKLTFIKLPTHVASGFTPYLYPSFFLPLLFLLLLVCVLHAQTILLRNERVTRWR